MITVRNGWGNPVLDDPDQMGIPISDSSPLTAFTAQFLLPSLGNDLEAAQNRRFALDVAIRFELQFEFAGDLHSFEFADEASVPAPGNLDNVEVLEHGFPLHLHVENA